MQIFVYSAFDQRGNFTTGEMDASSEIAVARAVQSVGQFPISAIPKAHSRRDRRWQLLPPRQPRRELVAASRELSMLLTAGMELDRALLVLVGVRELRNLRSALTRVLDRVREGEKVADALECESCFPKLYVSLVRAGESTGKLDRALQAIAEYLERIEHISYSIRSALVYPAILLATAAMSITAILVFVLPQFEPLFADAGKALPWSTRIVLDVGHFIGSFGWLLLAFAATAAFTFQRALRNQYFRLRTDASLLRFPLLGDLIRKIEAERFCRTLGTLLLNGETLPDALFITRDVLGNRAMAESVERARIVLREGGSLEEHLAKEGHFPRAMFDLIRLGEETGKLGEMLLRQADLDGYAVKRTIDRLLVLLVPALTILLGLIVAALIASMLVAILSVNELAL